MKHLIALAALAASLGTVSLAVSAAPIGGTMGGVSQIQSDTYAQPQGFITRKQAEAIAVRAVGGGHAVQAHRDDFHDRPVWEVTVMNDPFQYEVTVNARNGNVLRIRKHREDD